MNMVIVFGLVLLMIGGCSSAPPMSEEEVAKRAVIERTGTYVITGIDTDTVYVDAIRNLVMPGKHIVTTAFGWNGGSFSYSSQVECYTEAGHFYEVGGNRCIDTGLTKAGYAEYERKKAERIRIQEEADKKKYLEYKTALETPQSKQYLEQMKRDIESKRGGFINDPDNLLPLVNKQLFPLVEAEMKRQEDEANENARQRAISEKEAAAAEVKRAKDEAIRQATERKRITVFRTSLKDGDETNCGPIIEVKGKLVKVSYAVANYGNEHWIRRDSIFPSSYDCQFINGEYQSPQ
jgi:hypothetical protein